MERGIVESAADAYVVEVEIRNPPPWRVVVAFLYGLVVTAFNGDGAAELAYSTEYVRIISKQDGQAMWTHEQDDTAPDPIEQIAEAVRSDLSLMTTEAFEAKYLGT